MTIIKYCWRCNNDVAFLNEQEWDEFIIMRSKTVMKIKNYRQETGSSIQIAKSACQNEILEWHKSKVGIEINDYELISHHRLNDLGRDCERCGKPFRSKAARYCAFCGNGM